MMELHFKYVNNYILLIIVNTPIFQRKRIVLNIIDYR